MTFKHIKFSDSATMRSLEKVAKEKGLVQSEALEKTASKKKDYSVTDSLTENIIKLCNGLRDHGLHKHADELENNFINYKKADSLYQTSKETGEDLVDEAHPRGSHKLEGVDGDSVIETIVDQQIKDLEIVNKTPSGKLSKAEAINKVKVVLGQEANPISSFLKVITDNLSAISKLYHNESILTRPLIAGSPDDLLDFVKSITSPAAVDFSKIIVDAGKLYWDYKPNLLGGVSNQVWEEMDPLFSRVFAAARQGKDFIQNSPEPSKEGPVKVNIGDAVIDEKDPSITNFNNQISIALGTINKYVAQIKTDPELPDGDKNKALTWLGQKNNQIKELKSQFDGLSDQDKINVATGLLSNLQKITSNFTAFKNQWIG